MVRLESLVFFAQLAAFTTASPVQSTQGPQNNDAISKRENWNLDDLNKEFKGILWDNAFKDCNAGQLDKLIYTTRAAMSMLDLPFGDPEKKKEYKYTQGWNRYFGDYQWWLSNGFQDIEYATQIEHNLVQVQKYPREGHSSSTSNAKKIHFTCNYKAQVDGEKLCSSGITGAITVAPQGSSFERWTIAFCPYFFTSDKLKYLEDRTKGEKTTFAHIGDLDTYERVLAHELMHVDIVSYKPRHIEDVIGKLTPGGADLQIYGEGRCRDYARRDRPKANTAVRHNADNYSWFFLYYWFDVKWEWSKAGANADEPKTNNQNVEVASTSFPKNERDLQGSTGMPYGCTRHFLPLDSHFHPVVKCDYVGGDFTSKGGCDLTDQCRKPFANGNAVDPACVCTCDGKQTPLRDDKCAGFAGALPGRPSPP
ncbi:uncharacterized protein K460DRAFT_403404 [Cucurbitaria berberidis CBS 394.84]|uniref:Lysine-specific metallo-endopeptidase domain-containing protein n=1 Tax=Cucurbitaria berberidis CBS 394.84 TaxID=1168544 RepID=A0A9P4LBE2_9PLEO|nr:uncharacterized protein K460DRAFT_403404 [Cucurbitaria berberidis CBS 394.84]KAF1848104.1 hypothetical protein K460DRAFT_403404 [Cucurbitaria berberidis CBS 394.84]